MREYEYHPGWSVRLRHSCLRQRRRTAVGRHCPAPPSFPRSRSGSVPIPEERPGQPGTDAKPLQTHSTTASEPASVSLSCNSRTLAPRVAPNTFRRLVKEVFQNPVKKNQIFLIALVFRMSYSNCQQIKTSFKEVTRLPKREQETIIDVVRAVIAQAAV